MASVRAGRIADAIPHFELASQLLPDDEFLHNNLAAALIECGDYERGLAATEAALARNPDYPEAHHNRGVALRGLGRLPEAVEAAQRAVRLRPNYADGQTGLAMSLAQTGQLTEARAACQRALSVQPRSPLALLTLGTIDAREGNVPSALQLFGQAISMKPDLVNAYHYAGSLLQKIGQYDQAISCFEKAADLAPSRADLLIMLSDALASNRRRPEAISSLDRALEIEPENAFALVQRLHLWAWQCDWEKIRNELSRIPTLGIVGDPVSPFAMLGLEDAPERHRIRSERFAERMFGDIERLPPVAPQVRDHAKIRLGYVSADFHGHATAYLATRLFELHDRSAFEVHAFSHGRPADDAMRARLIAAFDEFHDISALGDEAAARRMRELGIDIAIDLKGYTEGQRLGILAHRPAPVQVSFLGYPGTTGASFIDYLVADPHVIPVNERNAYCERLIVLPHCYQPTDNRRAIGERPSRAEAGLPETGFVFASFNHCWKIGPAEFDLWTELLQAVEGSVLWLLAAGPEAEGNLRRQIEQRGVNPERLLFAPFLPQIQHLGRLALADLFLDTFTYGAHTTASDALWAGVPLVTCGGRGFATRVAASIVHAAGLPELTASSASAYKALALDLALNPARLASIRDRLSNRLETVPLFDSEAFARDFEAGLKTAYGRAVSGREPVDILVADLA